MSTTTIRASIHVSQNSDVSVRVDKLNTDNSKYAALSIGDATIFINSSEKALEIACQLEQAAKILENEDGSNWCLIVVWFSILFRP